MNQESIKKQIQGAYKSLGGDATFYDGMITCTTLPGKVICKLVWDMRKEENDAFLLQALSGIPEDFSGKLLEVPVGTGVLTIPMYESLPRAQITCLDYSTDMMARAQKRAEQKSLQNIRFIQGDVGKLPFADASFDAVLSLNGFHAFPDKVAAYRETFRVLKPGGVFCGCFYVRGEVARTDWFIRKLYQPKGFFTPPYETKQSLEKRLSALYQTANVTTIKGMAIFCCHKADGHE